MLVTKAIKLFKMLPREATCYHVKREQRNTMDKKICLSMHPRNFGPDKIICM